MSFFARLLGKKSQPKVVEKKPTNLEALSLDALIGVIKSGEDEQLRIAAIKKISDTKTLLGLAGVTEVSTVVASLQKAAKQQLIGLIESGSISVAELQESIKDKVSLLALLGSTNKTEAFEEIFNTISDESELAKIALEASTSKLRQAAAEKITDKQLLQKLFKDTKTKDKNVFKIVKEKCDAFKEEDKRIADIAAAVTAAVQSLEQQSNRPYDAQFSAKVSYLIQQWEAKKSDASAEMIARAQAAIEKCQAVIDAVSAEQDAQEAQRKAEVASSGERQAHIDQLHALLMSIVSSDVNVEETRALLKLLDAAWESLGNVKKPSAQEQKIVDGLRRIILQELDNHTAHGSLAAQQLKFEQLVADSSAEAQAHYKALKNRVNLLCNSFKENLPDVISQAQTAYEKWEKAAAEKVAEIQNAQRHIGGLIRKANETVAEGILGKAMGLRRAIDEKIQNFGSLPNHLANQLEQLDEALAKLQDWKNYAVVPKKHELIAQLEALDGSKEHPESLANKVKRIQDEWRSLSKGGKDQDQDLWEKFHELAQKVYQPCRDYFAEQATIRQNNLNACKHLVAQLKNYLENHDWEKANWKDVESVIRVARKEWRNHTPTERVATQPVLAEFEATLQAIQQKLINEFEKNSSLKKELIAQAQLLVNMEDSRKATDQVKQLQAKWQAVGPSLRKEEQHLWREFRSVCDAVFAKRQQQSEEFKAELEANLERAKALLADVQSLSELTAQPLVEARKRVDEIRQEFGALGQFPKAQVSEINTAFNKAIDAFEQKLRDERSALKQQVWINLFSINEAVNNYELALVQGENPAPESLQAKVDEITQWPTGGLKAIQQKIARANASADLDANLDTLRELCVRADILTGTETPADEQALRTAFQVNQLQQNFGRKAQDIATEFENLVFEWIAVGAVKADAYASLFARFNVSRQKAIK